MEGRELRQQPGFACEECRKRKARCDRGRPKCGFCAGAGTRCVTVDRRQQRGPKKGQLNAMRSQIDTFGEVTTRFLHCVRCLNPLRRAVKKTFTNMPPYQASLQWQLEQHLGSGVSNGRALPEKFTSSREIAHSQKDDTSLQGDGLGEVKELNGTNIGKPAYPPPPAASAETATSSSLESAAVDLATWVDPSCVDWQDLDSFIDHLDRMDAQASLMAGVGFHLTELMRGDLDQLYFDRAYPICPIIHRRRYFVWASQESPAPARACLQWAMRALAAAMSAHWCDLVDHVIAKCRHLLETQTQALASSKDETPLEHIQAWLLLAYAELLRTGERQAMLTAGRAFRFVQMARLYEVDVCDGERQNENDRVVGLDCLNESFIDAEERRRTFWLAFSLDRFLCMRSEWPLTLQEEMISTRLPAPDANFQDGRPIRVGFLSHMIVEQDTQDPLSPFAECIVLAALYGRCLTHRRAHVKHDAGIVEPYDFWTYQEWLASAVERRVQTLHLSPAVDSDPVLLFAHMMAHGAVILLSNVVQGASSKSTLEQQLVRSGYERRASLAALEMVRLAKLVPSLGHCKAHPFVPDLLSCAATFLSSVSGTVIGGSEGVDQVLQILRDLQVTNCLATEQVQGLNLNGSRSGPGNLVGVAQV